MWVCVSVCGYIFRQFIDRIISSPPRRAPLVCGYSASESKKARDTEFKIRYIRCSVTDDGIEWMSEVGNSN